MVTRLLLPCCVRMERPEGWGGGMDFQKQLAAALDAAGVPVDGSEEAAAADASVDKDAAAAAAAGDDEHAGVC